MSTSKILHLSDIHICRAYNSTGLKEWVLDLVQTHGVSHLALTGDLVETGNVKDLEPFLEGLPCPTLIVPGNHDIFPLSKTRWLQGRLAYSSRSYQNGFKRWNAVLQKRGLKPAPWLESLDGRWQVLGLNSVNPHPKSCFFSGAGVVSAQGLTTLLGRLSPHKKTLVLIHHFPFELPQTSAWEQNFLDLGQVQDMFKHLGPEIILCGHAHEEFGVRTLGPSQVINSASRPSQGVYRAHLITLEPIFQFELFQMTARAKARQ